MEAPCLAYNFPWEKYPQDRWPCILREYLDYGVSHFVFTDSLVRKCLEDKAVTGYLHSLADEFGVHFVAMHALCDREDDLDQVDMARRPAMIDEHVRALLLASEFGAKTCTMHIGAYCHVAPEYHTPLETLRKNTLEALDKLLPVAEECGVVLAIENAFEPPNAPDELLYYVGRCASSPAIGVCFDTGHANVMAPSPRKDHSLYEQYVKDSWWENGIVEEPSALEKLKPYIVTTHIHDNNGYGDQHAMPGDGNIDWPRLMPRLRDCPRMMEYQTEICFDWGTNWAGRLLAPKGGYSIKRQVETFMRIFS